MFNVACSHHVLIGNRCRHHFLDSFLDVQRLVLELLVGTHRQGTGATVHASEVPPAFFKIDAHQLTKRLGNLGLGDPAIGIGRPTSTCLACRNRSMVNSC